MDKLKKIRTISLWLRYTVIVISLAVLAGVFISQFYYDTWIVSFTNPTLDELWHRPEVDRTILYLVTSPLWVIIGLSVYWLQKLFGEYHRGKFFTNDNMTCYLWLVWLKFSHIIYSLVLPFVLVFFAETLDIRGAGVALDVSSFFSWLFLVCIVYVLKMAQEIKDENEEFI